MRFLSPQSVLNFWRDQQKHYIGATVVFLISFLLLIKADDRLSRWVATAGVLMSVGYGCGVAATSYSFSRRSDELQAEWDTRLFELQEEWDGKLTTTKLEFKTLDGQFEEAKEALREAIEKLKEADRTEKSQQKIIAELESRVHQYVTYFENSKDWLDRESERQKEHLHGQFAVQLAAAKERLEAQTSERNRAMKRRVIEWKLKTINSINRQAEVRLEETITALTAEFEAKYGKLQGEFNALYESNQETLEYLEQMIASVDEWKRIANSQIQTVAGQYSEEVNRLNRLIQGYLSPQALKGTSNAVIRANMLMKLLAQNGIAIQPEKAISHPGGIDEIWFDPRGHVLEEFQKLDSLVHQELGLLKNPRWEIERTFIKVTLTVDSLLEPGVQKEILEPSPTHLLEFLMNNPQVTVMGDSGEGKTTLINNLMRLMESEFGSSVRVVLTNPKPDEGTDLKRLKYYSFEDSIFGLLEAAVEILYRVEVNTGEIINSRTRPLWEPVIYMFDEASEVCGFWNNCKPDVMEAILNQFSLRLPSDRQSALNTIMLRVKPSSFAADLIKFCWRVGRSEKVKVLLAGQNLKAGTIGTQVRDLHQTACLYLGDMINEGLENRVPEWQQSALTKEFALRGKRAADGTGSRFFGLFVPKGGRSYFANIPASVDDLILSASNMAVAEVAPRLGQKQPGLRDDVGNLFALSGMTFPGTASKGEVTNLDEGAPDESLEHVDQGSGEVEVDPPKTGGDAQPQPWSKDARAIQLVVSARDRIIELIKGGMDRPIDICNAIWGDEVDPRSKPYNGKNGVKTLLEKMINEHRPKL